MHLQKQAAMISLNSACKLSLAGIHQDNISQRLHSGFNNSKHIAGIEAAYTVLANLDPNISKDTYASFSHRKI